MNSLFIVLSTVADVPENLFDRFLYGLQFSAIGISIVFVVLLLLMIVIKVFELIFYTIPNRKKAKAPVVEEIPVAQPTASADSDTEIAAVIAAAVDAYYASVNAGISVEARKKYQIKSFKRI